MVEAFKSADIDKMKKQDAESLRDKINLALIDLMKSRFKNPDIMPEGDKSLEGVAFELGGQLYGVHFPEWKELKQKYTGEMHEMDTIIKTFLA